MKGPSSPSSLVALNSLELATIIVRDVSVTSMNFKNAFFKMHLHVKAQIHFQGVFPPFT